MSSELPWYRDGLRFTCTQCGNCCTGAPGHVWVENHEIAALAQALGISEESFENTFVRRVGARKSLKELPNGDCILFDGTTRKCTVYSARPRQCRTWPFWDSNLNTQRDWEHTCQICPGSGSGAIHTLGEIEQQRSIIKV